MDADWKLVWWSVLAAAHGGMEQNLEVWVEVDFAEDGW